MDYMGFQINTKHMPPLDPDFIPLYGFFKSHNQSASVPYSIALEREDGYISRYDTGIIGSKESRQADIKYVELFLELLIYAWGGWRIYLCGDIEISQAVRDRFSTARHETAMEFIFHVYDRNAEFRIVPFERRPTVKDSSKPIGRHLDGCRIGLDIGGSDRKVSAVVDGNVIYSEEVEWTPKLMADPDYHYDGIVTALKTAASKMPRVDAIGVSSAGVLVNKYIKNAALFCLVPPELFAAKGRDIYLRAAGEIGDVPLSVENDGDVSALAGSMSLKANRVLGIAMGTSEAGGYVDAKGNIVGWLNELASAPVDLNSEAPVDPTAKAPGVGASYFSQDCVIRLADRAGIELDKEVLPSQKLKRVQILMEQGDSRAQAIYESIGCYLAHTLALYSIIYDVGHVLLLGRVTSGKGGDIILKTCNEALESEFPDIFRNLTVRLPDENSRRIGQSVAAASLPVLG